MVESQRHQRMQVEKWDHKTSKLYHRINEKQDAGIHEQGIVYEIWFLFPDKVICRHLARRNKRHPQCKQHQNDHQGHDQVHPSGATFTINLIHLDKPITSQHVFNITRASICLFIWYLWSIINDACRFSPCPYWSLYTNIAYVKRSWGEGLYAVT